MRLLRLAFAVLAVSAVAGPALAQDDSGNNSMSDFGYTQHHASSSSRFPIQDDVRDLELRGWPQGSRRPVSPRLVTERSAAILTAAGATCDIVEAHNPGETKARKQIYEVRCAQGPGFLINASEEPVVYNCLLLDAQEKARVESDPGATPFNLCLLEGSRDAVAVLQPMLAAAGIACEVDEARWIGRIDDAEDRYEVGCKDADGLWVQTAVNGASVTSSYDCLDLARENLVCAFTTPQEQASAVASLLPDSGAPPCTGERARFIGNAQGRLYELKCGDGSGFIFRVTPDGAFDQAWPCEQAATIAGGCRIGREGDGFV